MFEFFEALSAVVGIVATGDFPGVFLGFEEDSALVVGLIELHRTLIEGVLTV